MNFIYPPGASPLDPDEAAGLIPAHISLQRELNEWEETNILKAREWAFARKQDDMISDGFIRRLHREMFDHTWKWAGTYRWSDKNIGSPWEMIAEHVRNLCDDAMYWLEHKTYPDQEIAVRFKHRLAAVLPFPNGNGRHSRLMSDVIMHQLGHAPFTWGRANLSTVGDARRAYIESLRMADRGNILPLLDFARS